MRHWWFVPVGRSPTPRMVSSKRAILDSSYAIVSQHTSAWALANGVSAHRNFDRFILGLYHCTTYCNRQTSETASGLLRWRILVASAFIAEHTRHYPRVEDHSNTICDAYHLMLSVLLEHKRWFSPGEVSTSVIKCSSSVAWYESRLSLRSNNVLSSYTQSNGAI